MNWDRQERGEGPERSFEEFIQDFFDRPGMFFIVVLVIIAGAGVMTSFYTVEPNEKAVVTRLGKYIETSPEGLHFKLPFGIDHATLVPTQLQKEAFGFSATTSDVGVSQGQNPFSRSSTVTRSRNFDNESLMLTGDLNVAEVEWVVQYYVTNPKDYLFNVADPVKNIRDLTQTTMRKVVGDRSINDILTTGRADIQSEVKRDMQKVIDETYKMGVTIDKVLIQTVAPPESVRPSFNAVNSALQEQKQEINKAFENQNRIIPEAKGKAIREVSQARGYREAVVNQAIGDASRFEQVLKEYEKAPVATRKRLYLELIEQMVAQVSNFTVVDPDVKGVLPVFSSPDKGILGGGGNETRASLSSSHLSNSQRSEDLQDTGSTGIQSSASRLSAPTTSGGR